MSEYQVTGIVERSLTGNRHDVWRMIFVAVACPTAGILPATFNVPATLET